MKAKIILFFIAVLSTFPLFGQENRLSVQDCIDMAFRAMAEATEEAVINSMLAAERVTGYDGIVRRSLAEFL